MEVGSIYSHENFEFDNGTTKKKLLVVLSRGDKSKAKQFICALTTSKERLPERKIHADSGCQGGGDTPFQEHYHFFKANKDFFELDTWVIFSDLIVFEEDRFIVDSKGVPAVKEGNLKPENTRAVINCVLKSLDIYKWQETQIKAEQKILKDGVKSPK
jgi:hypothetical protein